MYGTQETAAAGGVLAATGATAGSAVLMAVGLALAAIALVMLLRRNGKNRP